MFQPNIRLANSCWPNIRMNIFGQDFISRSQEDFSEVREKPEMMKVDKEWQWLSNMKVNLLHYSYNILCSISRFFNEICC